MTNTINNVPRDLLNIAALHLEYSGYTETGKKLRTLLDAAPSPAGVDGLEVEAYLHTMHMEIGQTRQFCSKWKGDPFGVSGVDYSSTYSVTSEPLCRLSDAQAIIDGLRGEVERSKQFAAGHVLANGRISASLHAVEAERDQQAQRIGELERALLEVAASLAWNAHGECRAIHDGPIMPSKMAIDAAKAALSAGKEGE